MYRNTCIRSHFGLNYSLVIYGQLFVFEWWTLLIIYHARCNLWDKRMELFDQNICFWVFSNKLIAIIIFYIIFQLATKKIQLHMLRRHQNIHQTSFRGTLDLSQGNLTFLELELAACQTGPPAPGTPQWSCSMVELVEQSWKNWSRAVPNRP